MKNGFKCHCASDGHLRRVQLFGENPKRAIDQYSETFEQKLFETPAVDVVRSSVLSCMLTFLVGIDVRG